MIQLSVSQYQKTLPLLSDKRKSILLKLYAYGPFADTIQIADVLGYENFTAANVQIGTLGRVLGEQVEEEPSATYMHKGQPRPAYFLFVHDYTEAGWDLRPNLQKAMEKLGWTNEIADDAERLYTEVKTIDRTLFREGKVMQVLVNRYERDRKAKAACLKLHGNKCIACSLDFKEMYGDDIEDIIHVHHTLPFSKVKKEKVTDITKDLVPLCPNCHSVVHSKKEVISIKELQQRIRRNKL